MLNKLLLFSFLCVLFVSTANAQSHQKGTLSFQLGFDAGAHGVKYESKYDGVVIDDDTSGAATTMLYFSTHYNFAKWFSAGFNLSRGSYLEDPDNAEADGNTLGIFAFDFRFYPINKENFNWFAGLELGASNLEINRKYIFIIPFNTSYTYASGHSELYTGINWYFGKIVGINTRLGYSRHNFLMTDYKINGDNQDLDDFDNTLMTRGLHFRIGLSVKIN